MVRTGCTVLDWPDGDRTLIGLARVSTVAQDAQLQRDGLQQARCFRVFEEKVSSRKADRPGLAAALDYLRPGDTLVVWKLDRLGRSVKDVLIIADDLHGKGIGVRILTGKLAGTYTPTGEGKFFFTMMAAFAELERDIIHERTMAGLAAARAQGRKGGRPTVMDADKLAAARARRDRGESPSEIARALGISRASVYRHLASWMVQRMLRHARISTTGVYVHALEDVPRAGADVMDRVLEGLRGTRWA